jgi:transposase
MRALQIRPLTDEERKVIDKLASSGTAPAGLVRRAQLLKQMAQGASAPQAAAVVGGVTGETARQLLKHCNQEGVKALEDRPRSGRPPTITEEDRGRLLLLAKTPPEAGLAAAQGACHWTLDALLQAARSQGIPIGRTRLWKVLRQEGIRWWRQPRSWLESPDPQLPEKRGRLPVSIPPHQRGP